MKRNLPQPPGWEAAVLHDLNFELGYRLLDGYEHFHSEALRSFVRMFQLRFEEARAHLERAEELYRRQRSEPNALHFEFFLRVHAADLAMIEELANPESGLERRTDRALLDLVEPEEPRGRSYRQARISSLGFYKILRGDYTRALESFDVLLEESSSRVEDQQASHWSGAAAACWALGREAEARLYYEKASLGVALISQPLRVAVYSARLSSIVKHWGDDEESAAWIARIDRLGAPKASRDAVLAIADIFTSASRSRNRLVCR